MRKKSKEVKIKKAYIFLFLDKLIKKKTKHQQLSILALLSINLLQVIENSFYRNSTVLCLHL